jgi:hypothetical protein
MQNRKAREVIESGHLIEPNVRSKFLLSRDLGTKTGSHFLSLNPVVPTFLLLASVIFLRRWIGGFSQWP